MNLKFLGGLAAHSCVRFCNCVHTIPEAAEVCPHALAHWAGQVPHWAAGDDADAADDADVGGAADGRGPEGRPLGAPGDPRQDLGGHRAGIGGLGIAASASLCLSLYCIFHPLACSILSTCCAALLISFLALLSSGNAHFDFASSSRIKELPSILFAWHGKHAYFN